MVNDPRLEQIRHDEGVSHESVYNSTLLQENIDRINNTDPAHLHEFRDDFYDLDRDGDHLINSHELGEYRQMLGRDEIVSEEEFRNQNRDYIAEIEQIDGAVIDHEVTE